MEETKKCPFCGEEILSIAKKCKHCGEWLTEHNNIKCPVCGEHIDENLTVCPNCEAKINNPTPDSINPENVLYCRQCKKSISMDALQCPHCGNPDPFLFSTIKKDKSTIRLSFGYWIVLIIVVEGIFKLFGHDKGIFKWGLQEIFIFILVWAILETLLWAIRKSRQNDYKRDMTEVFHQVGDSNALKRWEAKLESFLND